MEHAETTWRGVAGIVAVENSFEDFFELEQERLLRLLWMVTGSLQEAEDIVQDAFLRVWEGWPKVSTRAAGVFDRGRRAERCQDRRGHADQERLLLERLNARPGRHDHAADAAVSMWIVRVTEWNVRPSHRAATERRPRVSEGHGARSDGGDIGRGSRGGPSQPARRGIRAVGARRHPARVPADR